MKFFFFAVFVDVVLEQFDVDGQEDLSTLLLLLPSTCQQGCGLEFILQEDVIHRSADDLENERHGLDERIFVL